MANWKQNVMLLRTATGDVGYVTENPTTVEKKNGFSGETPDDADFVAIPWAISDGGTGAALASDDNMNGILSMNDAGTAMVNTHLNTPGANPSGYDANGGSFSSGANAGFMIYDSSYANNYYFAKISAVPGGGPYGIDWGVAHGHSSLLAYGGETEFAEGGSEMELTPSQLVSYTADQAVYQTTNGEVFQASAGLITIDVDYTGNGSYDTLTIGDGDDSDGEAINFFVSGSYIMFDNIKGYLDKVGTGTYASATTDIKLHVQGNLKTFEGISMEGYLNVSGGTLSVNALSDGSDTESDMFGVDAVATYSTNDPFINLGEPDEADGEWEGDVSISVFQPGDAFNPKLRILGNGNDDDSSDMHLGIGGNLTDDAGGGSFGGTSAVLVNESVVSGDVGEDDVLSPGHLAIITLNDGSTKVPGFKFTES